METVSGVKRSNEASMLNVSKISTAGINREEIVDMIGVGLKEVSLSGGKETGLINVSKLNTTSSSQEEIMTMIRAALQEMEVTRINEKKTVGERKAPGTPPL